MFCIFWIKQVLQFCNAKFLLLYSSLLVARTFQCSELHLHWNMKLLSFTFAFFSCWCNFLFFSSTFRSLEVFSTPGEFGVVRRAFHRKTGQQVAAPRHVFFQHLCLTVVHRWFAQVKHLPKTKKSREELAVLSQLHGHDAWLKMFGWCLIRCFIQRLWCHSDEYLYFLSYCSSNVSQKHALKHGHVELKMSEFSSISMHVPRKTLPSCSNIMRQKRRWVSALKCSSFSQHDDSTDLTRGKNQWGSLKSRERTTWRQWQISEMT